MAAPQMCPGRMLFPSDPTQLPRHPSQLYEALLEGLVLFLIINWFARKPRLLVRSLDYSWCSMAVSALWLSLFASRMHSLPVNPR